MFKTRMKKSSSLRLFKKYLGDEQARVYASKREAEDPSNYALLFRRKIIVLSSKGSLNEKKSPVLDVPVTPEEPCS
jgi:hypothetical protein